MAEKMTKRKPQREALNNILEPKRRKPEEMVIAISCDTSQATRALDEITFRVDMLMKKISVFQLIVTKLKALFE